METATEIKDKEQDATDDIAIRVSGLSKRYVIGGEREDTLRGTLANAFGMRRSKSEEFWALRNIDFEVKKGEVIGIIGKNGAGKSTLLKILSRITQPTSGKVEINGRVASLLEVGTGFHPELTGRENVFLNGTILGMSRQEVKDRFDEIVEFSGVRKFIDTPVKHYSSGMYVRLAFAVAAHLDPEILIIDEVLAVGDSEFQKKCIGKMQDVAGQGRTVLFVSHNMGAVKKLCKIGVYLENGACQAIGSTEEITELYQQKNFISRGVYELKNGVEKYENESVRVLKAETSKGHSPIFKLDENIQISYEFENNELNQNLGTTIEILDRNNNTIIHEGILVSQRKDSKKGTYVISTTIPKNLLNVGIYKLNLIFGLNQKHLLLHCENLISFEIINDSYRGSSEKTLPGILKLNLDWNINKL